MFHSASQVIYCATLTFIDNKIDKPQVQYPTYEEIDKKTRDLVVVFSQEYFNTYYTSKPTLIKARKS